MNILFVAVISFAIATFFIGMMLALYDLRRKRKIRGRFLKTQAREAEEMVRGLVIMEERKLLQAYHESITEPLIVPKITPEYRMIR